MQFALRTCACGYLILLKPFRVLIFAYRPDLKPTCTAQSRVFSAGRQEVSHFEGASISDRDSQNPVTNQEHVLDQLLYRVSQAAHLHRVQASLNFAFKASSVPA